MSNERKRTTKSADLPPRGNRNLDPITKAPGAHPVEVGAGAALVGAAAGLAAGAMAGPVGAVLGTVVGGVAGGYGGKAVGEAIDPTTKARARPGRARTGRTKGGSTATAGNGARAKRAAAGSRAGAARSALRRGKAAGTRAAKTRAGGDDRGNRGPRDRARVNVSEPWEVDYWCKRLDVTPARLRQAVRKAGPAVRDVRRELGK